MDTVYCSKCGGQISDNVKYCPNCGCEITNSKKETKTSTLIIERFSAAYFCACKYDVYLDGNLWGCLKNGNTLTIDLVCGNHQISVIDKNNMNRTVLNEMFTLKPEGLKYSFTAKLNPEFSKSIVFPSRIDEPFEAIQMSSTSSNDYSHSISQTNTQNAGLRCEKCGGVMVVQTISENKKTGCGTVLLYILLAITVLGFLIIIPLALRNKSQTTTYAVCQNCGHKKKIKATNFR